MSALINSLKVCISTRSRGLGQLLLLALLVLAFGCASAPLPQPRAVAGEIIKSPADPREYRYLVLENGVKVTLVHSEEARIAAAAVGVHSGHLQEPDEWPGLAHLLEHMLFLGSEKYPGAEAFDDFLADHGGSSNAVTSDTDTIYYFSVDNNQLEAALERMFWLVTAPTIKAEYLDRERHAVDSEFQIYRQRDMRRVLHVEKATSNPRHPGSRFSTGNLNTLSDHNGLSLRQALMDFHQRWYTGPNTSVALVSSDSLDDQEQMVRRLFAAMNSRPTPEPVALPERFEKKQRGLRIDVETREQLRGLILSFALPADKDYIYDKPQHYLAHLLGHEGKHSLHSLLLKAGLIEQLSVWGDDDGREASLTLELDLAPYGFQRIDEIITMVFSHIRMLEEQGVSQPLFSDLQAQMELGFRFLEPGDPETTATMLVEYMPRLPAEELIQSHYRIPRYSPDKIKRVLHLLTPENLRVLVLNNAAPPVDSSLIREEPWTGTRYSVQPLDGNLLRQLQSPPAYGELAPPALNEYMPENLELVVQAQDKQPELLPSVPGLKVWFRHDHSFAVPRANIIIKVVQPELINTPRGRMLFQLYARMLQRRLVEPFYQATQAGLGFTLSSNYLGFTLEVGGFSDKLSWFLQDLLQRMQTVTIDNQELELARDNFREQFENQRKKEPLRLQTQAITRMLFSQSFSREQQLQALTQLTPKDLQDWVSSLFSQASITALIDGNLARSSAQAIARQITPLVSGPDRNGIQIKPRLLPGEAPMPVCQLSYDHDDYTLSIAMQGHSRDLATRASYRVLASLLKAPFYNRLRTEEQIGYSLGVVAQEIYDYPLLMLRVQSAEMAPPRIGERIRVLLNDLHKSMIADLTDEALASHTRGMLAELLETPQSLSEQTGSFWLDINAGFTGFDQQEQLAQAVKAVTVADVQALYNQLLQGRNQIQLHGYGAAHQPQDSRLPECGDDAFLQQFGDRPSR